MGDRGVLPTRLRQARNVAGLYQTDIAAALGISQQRYATWETGTIPQPKHHAALADALGVELVVLLGWIADAYRERADTTARDLADARRDVGRLVDYIEEQSKKNDEQMTRVIDALNQMREILDRQTSDRV